MNKTDKLTKLLEQRCLDKKVCLDDDGELEDPLPFSIEFRPRKGWYLVFAEPRYYYDDGEFMGETYYQAEKWLYRYFL